jgi:hypothetical protein
MPLRDHFRPPLVSRYPWESFHRAWAVEIVAYLNRLLPRRYLATVHAHLDTQVAAEVAEFERPAEPGEESTNGPAGEGGVAVQTWAPPATTMVLPAVYPDDLEVRVRDMRDDARLVAVVELVSPSNKDRPEARYAFAAKCAAYLQRGVGLVTADIVTGRNFNLHNELIDLLHLQGPFTMAEDVSTYAVAYRPARRQETDQIDVWAVPLAVGGELPTLPLALLGTRAVPLDLNGTYQEACARSRL